MQIGILEPEKFSNDAIALLKTVGEVSLYNGKNLKKFLFSCSIFHSEVYLAINF